MVGYTMLSLWILSQPIVETGASYHPFGDVVRALSRPSYLGS